MVKNGFPSPWERAEFMAANRARSDPSTVKGPQSTVYPALAPLVLEYNLERSARFHATTLETGMAPLMHPSPCTLNTDVGTSGCDGKPACACTTGTTCNNCNTCSAGTDPFTRIGYFYAPGGRGEIAAAGYGDPWSVMEGWVNEPAGADGHRTIVDGAPYGLAGFGSAGGAMGACWSAFDVGDFATATSAPPKIASAAPKPFGGAAGTFRVYATWNDPAAGAPMSLRAVVDGKCGAMMTKELGDPKLNATYYEDVPLTDGCHTVFILGHDAGGTRLTYPTTTAFTIAVGGGACAEEMPQPGADCEAMTGVDAGGSPTDGGGSGSDASAKPDGATTNGDGGGTSPGRGGGGADGGDGAGAGNNDTTSSSGCSVVARVPQTAGFSAFGLALAALGLVRRRRT